MRLVVAKPGPDGHDTVVHVEELAPPAVGTSEATELWATRELPPLLPQVPVDGHKGVGPGPGQTSWLLLSWPPGRTGEIHHTDLISYCAVLAGSVELVLDTDSVHLGPGDLLAVVGVRHGWCVGDDGCVISCVALGADRQH